MPLNRSFNLNPVALTTTLTTNVFNPPTLAGGVGLGPVAPTATYVIFRHFRVVNKTASPATFSLWKGATGANAAGTEFLGTGFNIPANSGQDFNGLWRFDSADFLVGGASAATALTIEGEGEMGVAG